MRWVPFGLVLIATGFDFYNHREIPNAIPLLILIWSAISAALGWQTHGWLSAAGGCALGSGVGLLLLCFNAFGGGDVKLIGSLGAVFGIATEISFLGYAFIAGGVLGLIALLRDEREFAYTPAIAVGVLAVTLRGVR